MRVASRRLRSALRTYRPLLDAGATDPVRDELRWLANLLGVVRDAQVLQRRLTDLATDLAGEPGIGTVRRRVDLELCARRDSACAELAAALDSDRYQRLVHRLRAVAADPPTTPAATGRAIRALPDLVRTAAVRVDVRARAVRRAGTSRERNASLHEVRKAAKRARYAAEAATPVLGKPARRVAARMRQVQAVLGEHQDSVVAGSLLRELSSAARVAGEDYVGYSRLRGEERRRARAARRAYAVALGRAQRATERLRP